MKSLSLKDDTPSYYYQLNRNTASYIEAINIANTPSV
jgi:hypothetical protein